MCHQWQVEVLLNIITIVIEIEKINEQRIWTLQNTSLCLDSERALSM